LALSSWERGGSSLPEVHPFHSLLADSPRRQVAAVGLLSFPFSYLHDFNYLLA
jgi:hypothetical protein